MKGSLMSVGLAGLLGVSLAVAVGCSSSSSGGGSTPSGTYCDVTTAGIHECYGYTNLSADQASSVSSSCTSSLMGSVVSSCPSGGVGCCAFTISGYTVNECYYCGDASSYKTACTAQSGATWTAGSGGSTTCGATGDAGGTTDSGTTGGDSGSTTGGDAAPE